MGLAGLPCYVCESALSRHLLVRDCQSEQVKEWEGKGRVRGVGGKAWNKAAAAAAG